MTFEFMTEYDVFKNSFKEKVERDFKDSTKKSMKFWAVKLFGKYWLRSGMSSLNGYSKSIYTPKGRYLWSNLNGAKSTLKHYITNSDEFKLLKKLEPDVNIHRIIQNLELEGHIEYIPIDVL